MANYYPQATHTTTDAQLIALWLLGKRRATQTSYAAVIRQFQSFIGDKGLADVGLEEILLWLGSLELRGFTASTINQRLAAIRSLFAFACKCGYLQFNVAQGVKTQPPSDVLHERILEQEEVKKLIGAAKSERDRLLLSLLYATGLRVSEICSLNWSDLKPRKGGGQATIIGKGGKARTVLIGQGLWQQILGLERSEKTSAVFVSRTGRRLDRTMLHKIIKDCAERAGVNPHVSAHWLRHAHACHSLENGCDIDVLMRSLGHSSLTVTSKYLHARPNEGSSQFIELD
jgi:integrase/recombinase XerD